MKRKIIAGMLILAMILSVAFVPGGEVSAAGKLLSAKIPGRYQKGYTIYRAIDISAHQGSISLAQFRQIRALGITHVIIRSSYTRLNTFQMKADKHFKTNITNAHKAGLKIGIYHYSQAKTPAEAKKEAAFTLAQIRPYKSRISMPVVFDFEFGKRFNASYAKKMGKNYMTGVITTYCEDIKKAGFRPMVYASASVMNRYVNRNTLQAKYPIWIAHYTKGGKATDYSGSMYMWQYSSKGVLNDAKTGKPIISKKVSKYVDMNYIFVKNNGKTAAKKTATAAKSTSYKVKITGNVNKRTGPAKSYKKVGTLKKGAVVKVLQTKNGWGRIGNNVWFSLKYAKRI